MFKVQIDSIQQLKVKYTSLQNFNKIGWVVYEFKEENFS